MYDPNYILSDLDILAKYGLKPYSNQEELSLQVTLLYCLKNGYSIFLTEDVDRQVSTLSELMKVLPDDLVKVLEICMLRPHRFYDPEIAMSVYQASKNVNFLHTSEYTQVLVALIQTSEPFLTHRCHDYKHTLFLAEILKNNSCETIEYDQQKYPFLRALLPQSVSSVLCYGSDIYKSDHLYRFIISELSGNSGICPPERGEWADSSISDFYDPDGSMYSVEEYLENSCGGYFEIPDEDETADGEGCDACVGVNNILIMDTSDFNQTFFRFLDRYEMFDVILIPYIQNWQNTSEKEREIRSCIEERMLSEVISDGRDAYMLLHGWGDGKVRFKSYFEGDIVDFPSIPSGDDGVTYESILEHRCSLNPYLYMVPFCDEDHVVVSLGDICSIDEEQIDLYMQSFKSHTLLPDFNYAKNLVEVYMNEEPGQHHVVETPYETDRSFYYGPHVHMTKEFEFISSNEDGYYLCPEKANWALRIKGNKVSVEYLVYSLFNCSGFQEFIASNPPEELLLKRKLAILRDYKKQEEVIQQVKNQAFPVVSSNNSYKVALLVPDCPDWIKVSMGQCWCMDYQEFEHIKGECGFLEVLSKGETAFDAVIVDAVVDSVRDRYKGLRELLTRVRSKDTPIYLFTDVSEESLQEDLSEEEFEYIVRDRYYKRTDGEPFKILIRNLRRELDGEDKVTAKIRGQYVREFEAASWLDKQFPHLRIPTDLEFCLSHPSDSFSKVRPILNGLYEIIMSKISNGSGLDKVTKRGMLPSLLKDGKFDVDNKTFIIKGSVMPLPLAISLRFASDIANGEIHTENRKMDIRRYHSLVRSENLAHAVIHILMDFILWLYDVNFEFEGFCESRDPNILKSVRLTGILQQADRDEYYCDTDKGRIHVIVPKGKEKIGAEINISQVKYETKYHDKYELVAPYNAWSYREESR